MSRDPAALVRLRGALAGTVDESAEHLESLGADASGLRAPADARVRPEGVDDLVALLRWAGETRCPIVARGGGTSLDGESVPVRGGVVVDFSGWDGILEIAPEDGLARVQPGVINRALDRALGAHGLTFPPNPGSGDSCTIGGNVATNASGPRSLRYGSTRKWVRGLEVVDGRARCWTAGGRFAKSSVGPDLVGLLVGSEGTLALFAEITVQVAVRPARRTGIVLGIPASRPLGRLVADLKALLGPTISALEYVDQGTSEVLGRFAGQRWPAGDGALLIEVEGTEGEEGDALTRLDAGWARWGAPEAPAVFPDAERLWRIRGDAGPALAAESGPGVREDVGVPGSRLDALIDAIHRVADRHRVGVRIFGHIGEGNLHPVFALDPASSSATALREDLYRETLRLGGTLSGEHGIGVTKRGRLPGQLGASGIELLWAVKRELDPYGILNPGKLLPDDPPGTAASP